MVRPDLTRHKRKREFEIRNVQKEKKSGKCVLEKNWICCHMRAGRELRVHSGCFRVGDLLCGGWRRAKCGDAALPVVVLQLGRRRQRVGHLLHLVVGRLGFGFLFAERLLEGAAQLQGGVEETKTKTNSLGQYHRPLP